MMTDRRLTLWDKVMARVTVLPCGCHRWDGPDSGSGRGGGYGRICIDGATMAVHIVMWVIRFGPIPPKKQLDHTCVELPGNAGRRCCNPEHLELVTHKTNQKRRDLRRAKEMKQ
jgi:hypothetical protein